MNLIFTLTTDRVWRFVLRQTHAMNVARWDMQDGPMPAPIDTPKPVTAAIAAGHEAQRRTGHRQPILMLCDHAYLTLSDLEQIVDKMRGLQDPVVPPPTDTNRL